MDTIAVTGNHEKEIKGLKAYLGKNFEIKDIGIWEFKYFLGIKVVLSKKWIVLLKHKYSLDSLDRKAK